MLWAHKTGDDVQSSPAIGGDGTVYVGCDDGHVYAVHGGTVALVWKVATGGLVRSSPTVTAGRVGAGGE